TYKVVMEVTNESRNPDARAGQEKSPERGRAHGSDNKQGAPDFEAMWERMKGKLPPEVTKEVFIKRAKERMAAANQPTAPSALAAGGATSGTARYIQPGSPVYRGDLSLLPGMTANVSIVTNRKEDVLKVASVALRFNPAAFMKDQAPSKPEAKPTAGAAGGGQRQGGGLPARGMVARREDKVWILENGKPKAFPIKVGISDGQYTEVMGENLTEGMIVLTGVDDTKKAAVAATPIGGPQGPGGRR
ncbi:MAG: hypothetical protein WAT51_07855, partial [Holophaga sp.]